MCVSLTRRARAAGSATLIKPLGNNLRFPRSIRVRQGEGKIGETGRDKKQLYLREGNVCGEGASARVCI